MIPESTVFPSRINIPRSVTFQLARFRRSQHVTGDDIIKVGKFNACMSHRGGADAAFPSSVGLSDMRFALQINSKAACATALSSSQLLLDLENEDHLRFLDKGSAAVMHARTAGTNARGVKPCCRSMRGVDRFA